MPWSASNFRSLLSFHPGIATPGTDRNGQNQSTSVPPDASVQTFRTTSRAVLLDVIVSDRKGKPVTGLKQEDFTIIEQGRPQTVSFFEEHTGAIPDAEVELPKLPPNIFSNFSPFPRPTR